MKRFWIQTTLCTLLVLIPYTLTLQPILAQSQQGIFNIPLLAIPLGALTLLGLFLSIHLKNRIRKTQPENGDKRLIYAHLLITLGLWGILMGGVSLFGGFFHDMKQAFPPASPQIATTNTG